MCDVDLMLCLIFGPSGWAGQVRVVALLTLC